MSPDDTSETSTSYDLLPYESLPIYFAYPDALAAQAYVGGLDPAPLARCRMLELGCAAGGNMVPLAQSYPAARFVGVDLSTRQIADGQEVVNALGLTNVELRAASILDVDESLGQFDYIVAHGVYSWVPAEVRAKILSICKSNLAPNGVAYVSFNALPGWAFRTVGRQMLRHHTRHASTPQERLAGARAFLTWMGRALGEQQTLHAGLVREWSAELRAMPDDLLLHDHLEAVSQPFFLHEFVDDAQRAGLQYLGESCRQPPLGGLAPDALATLRELATDRVALEQHLDYLHGEAFRRTLLCHADTRVARGAIPQRLAQLAIETVMKPKSRAPEVRSSRPEEFESLYGAIETPSPPLKAVLVALSASPRPLRLGELAARARELLGPGAASLTDKVLFDVVLSCHNANLLLLHSHPPRFTTTVGERPLGSPLARLQAQRGGRRLATLRHRVHEATELDACVLPLLDGTRDQAAILAELAGAAQQKRLPLGGGAGDAKAQLRDSLGRLAQAALLVDPDADSTPYFGGPAI